MMTPRKFYLVLLFVTLFLFASVVLFFELSDEPTGVIDPTDAGVLVDPEEERPICADTDQILLNGTCVDGIEENETEVNYSDIIGVLTINEEWIEEMKQSCLEHSRRYCEESCNEESGLISKDGTYDSRQFDIDGDGNYSESEWAEWDYVLWVNGKCHDRCVEEFIYPCYT